MKVKYIQECVCGAVSVTLHNGSFISMSRETFDSMNFQGEWLPSKFYNCNHCVNNWGIDLCECGSGEPVGQCDCGSKRASQELDVEEIVAVLWVF